MMMEYITMAGFVLAVFVAGVAVGKLVEKVERHIREKDDEEHKHKKTTASKNPTKIKAIVFFFIID